MRKLILFAIVGLAVPIAAASASAQRPTRVNFKRGAHSAVVTGYLSSYKE